jgi:hypothetical protein
MELSEVRDGGQLYSDHVGWASEEMPAPTECEIAVCRDTSHGLWFDVLAGSTEVSADVMRLLRQKVARAIPARR